MHIITARTSNVRRLEDHLIIFGLVSFDTDQGQINVEVTVQPETEAELAMPQALMIREAKETAPWKQTTHQGDQHDRSRYADVPRCLTI